MCCTIRSRTTPSVFSTPSRLSMLSGGAASAGWWRRFEGLIFVMTDLADLTALELLQKYRDKSLSPVEYFDWMEKHIAAWEPKLQALYLYRPEVGREEAIASAARWAKGTPKGPLDGVPVTVKELIATKGDP